MRAPDTLPSEDRTTPFARWMFPAPPSALRELRRRALRRESPFFARVDALRRTMIRAGRTIAPLQLERAYETVKAELGGLRPLSPGDFVHVRGAPTSQLVAPAVLSLELGEAASEVLRRMLRDPRVGALLRDANFSPGDLAFRVDLDGDVVRIGGEDGSSVLHLSAIAHELGHCLYEEVHGLRGKCAVVLSEASAQWFQSFVVTSYLRARGWTEEAASYCAYEERIDLLGLYFFDLYRCDVADAAPVVPLFEARFRVFHPAYFHVPGYECIFALGAAYRRKLARRAGAEMTPSQGVLRLRREDLFPEAERAELEQLYGEWYPAGRVP